MSALKRILYTFFITLPAIGFCILIYANYDDYYYWQMYSITAAAFILASLFLGYLTPSLLQKIRIKNPWLYILIPAIFAYLIAGFTLAVTSLTPLCVWQDNGDGVNDLARCISTAAVVFGIYSPVELILLIFSTFLGVATLSETPLPAMKLNFRIIVIVLLTLTLLLAAAIPITVMVSTALNYEGKCYGFTDGISDCTWWEYASNEMGFMIILTFMPLASLAGAWVVTAITWAVNRFIANKRAQTAANWIGTGLLVILSFIFFPYVVFILGGGLLSSIFGNL